MTGGGVVGAGYEGLRIEEFVAGLRSADVEVVVDVRLTPMSRKPGFGKRALAEHLAAAGIGYEHVRALGNPRDNRAGFGGDAGELAEALGRYEELLTSEEARAALDHIAGLAATKRVVLLCFEADENRCHRQAVLSHVEARLRST